MKHGVGGESRGINIVVDDVRFGRPVSKVADFRKLHTNGVGAGRCAAAKGMAAVRETFWWRNTESLERRLEEEVASS